jgi:hypothetical protein
MSGWRDRAKQRVRELAGVTQATQHPEFEAAKAELLSVSAKYHTLMQLSEDVCWFHPELCGIGRACQSMMCDRRLLFPRNPQFHRGMVSAVTSSTRLGQFLESYGQEPSTEENCGEDHARTLQSAGYVCGAC